MNSHKIQLLAIIALSFLLVNVFSQKGYEIKVKISALKDSTVILAHYFAKENSFLPDDTVKLDKKGIGVFEGPEKLEGGMYIVYLPTKRYFDLILGDNQIFSVEADTSDLQNRIKFQGSLDNDLFYEYRNLVSSKGVIVSKLNEKKRMSLLEQQKDSITKVLENINQEVLGFVKKVIDTHPDLYIAVWLKSLQEIEIPDFPRDTKGNVIDSAFKYRYWHCHYFDNFNLADVRLLHTPFYEKKLKYYLEKVIPLHPDSINLEIDKIMGIVNKNTEVFRYILGTLYNHYAALANQFVGMDGIFIYFAEKYYLPNATWADDKFKKNLKKDIAKIKPNLVGNIAPNIPLIEVPTDHFMVAKMDTAIKSDLHVGSLTMLHNIKSKFLILAFWEVDCGHCRHEMPLLYDSVYPRIKDKGVNILAIHMVTSVEGKRKWVDFVNEHYMYDWTNTIPYGYEYKELYNTYTIPTIYILDENKKILAKRIGINQIEEVINMELRKLLVTSVNKQ
jgi:thiol-disulfide isomerase/thioredoxin